MFNTETMTKRDAFIVYRCYSRIRTASESQEFNAMLMTAKLLGALEFHSFSFDCLKNVGEEL